MIITLINNMIEIVQVVCSDHAFGHENNIVIIKLYKKKIHTNMTAQNMVQINNVINFTDNIYKEKAIYTPIPGINMRCYRFMF